MKIFFEHFSGTEPLFVAQVADIDDATAAGADILRLTIDDAQNGLIIPKEAFAGQRLSLEDIFAAYPDKCFNCNLNGKSAAAPFCAFIKNANASERILVSSPHRKNLKIVRKLLPAAATSFSAIELLWLYWLFRSGFLPLIKKFSADAIMPEFTERSGSANYSFIDQISKKGIQVFIWNTGEDAQKFIDSGVRGFITSDYRQFKNIPDGL
ncbi:MAG: hypothetical protein FWG92_02815 [Leptospirales bacterium]|nr:hypothetical protein [Leptospirales bacterium]